jgi:hypothetical protein
MENWRADYVERWPLERLVLYSRNARTHSPAQVDQIAGSISLPPRHNAAIPVDGCYN